MSTPEHVASGNAAARVLALLYGIVCYAVFFATFLYAIGFVSGFVVPRHIDSGAGGDAATALLIDLVLLSLFAIQHSGMARQGFKRWWTRIVPKPIERSTYVLLASLVLILLFWQWRALSTPVWDVRDETLRWGLYGLGAAGWLLVLASTFVISHFDLFGLRQVWLLARGRDYAELPFVTRAFYRLVRHPLYLGFLLAFWAAPTMSQGHLLFAAVTTAYILAAIQLEERDMVAVFGETYRDYRRRVPMLLPLPKRRPPGANSV